MSNKPTFRFTFHVLHPTISASEIENIFRLPVRFSQSAGEQRKTKTGNLLDGTYANTNVSFGLHEKPLRFDEVLMAEFIKKQLENYDHEYIHKLVETGGSCNFLLGVFSSDNVMFELDNEIIFMLSSSRISIKFDFYGGEE